MRASKSWGTCGCGCGHQIVAGDSFEIEAGEFYFSNHAPATERFGEEMGTLAGMEDTRTAAEVEIARRDAERREQRRENPLEGTMFDAQEMEVRATEQLSLF